MTFRKKIKEAKRIVFKLGTSTIANKDGNIALSRIYSFIESLSDLKKEGKEIIIVTSGAVGMGAKLLDTNQLKNVEKFDPVSVKQACAAVGQGKLMHFYEEALEKFNIITAQILLTADDFANRKKYLSLRNTLSTLLELGVVPIINENDTVSTSELECYKENDVEVCFGDNDKLSALVTSKLDADLLVILSDIDGLYDDDPRINKEAKIISVVTEMTSKIEALGFEASKGGRGGMKTKIEAAKVVMHSGGMLLIANGKESGIINKIFNGEEIGTLFLPVENLSGRKKWIAYATNINSYIKVNNRAKKALVEKKASLMPIGIIEIINSFKKGEVVSILDEDGKEFAKGMTNYSCSECEKVIGKHSDEIEKILGFKNYDTIITRDNMVIL
ncbi:MAG: glutamate 5-kinase [Candidatus Melainabacteria bacterium GWA2_34_9]|nr:MAG: glutamate 5-kinase [Candidatus Melainabacteria bacterium GWA2_34_9]